MKRLRLALLLLVAAVAAALTGCAPSPAAAPTRVATPAAVTSTRRPTATPQPPQVPLLWLSANLAPDDARRELVLFTGPAVGPETWLCREDTWLLANPPASPPERRGACMVFDEVTGSVLLYGAVNDEQGLLGDTWLWDGEGWKEAHPPSAPPPRGAAAWSTIGRATSPCSSAERSGGRT